MMRSPTRCPRVRPVREGVARARSPLSTPLVGGRGATFQAPGGAAGRASSARPSNSAAESRRPIASCSAGGDRPPHLVAHLAARLGDDDDLAAAVVRASPPLDEPASSSRASSRDSPYCGMASSRSSATGRMPRRPGARARAARRSSPSERQVRRLHRALHVSHGGLDGRGSAATRPGWRFTGFLDHERNIGISASSNKPEWGRGGCPGDACRETHRCD